MKMMISSWTSAAILLAVGLSSAHAGETSDGWNFTVTPYIWVPGIDASAKIPPAAGLPGGSPFPVAKTSVLDALNFAFMGSFEARKGDWSIYGDFDYADLGFDKQAPTALVVKGKVDFSQTLFELAGARRLWADANGSHFDVLLGARIIDISSDITLTLASRQFKFSADKSDTDVIGGLKGEARFDGSNWFVPYYADIGGGSSNHSWLASVGVGYAFGSGDLSLNYRYFEFDPGASSPVEDVRLYGPTLAYAFHF